MKLLRLTTLEEHALSQPEFFNYAVLTTFIVVIVVVAAAAAAAAVWACVISLN
jgi:hypothetical protein